MRGFPKFFATKEDYLNCLPLFPEQTKSALRQLYADRFVWKKIRELAPNEEFVQTAEYIVQEEEVDNEKKRFIYQQVEDDNARYLQLGFTKEEIDNIIS